MNLHVIQETEDLAAGRYKMDLQVCCCSAGLEVILKVPPAVLQQWEDVDDGQGKQASRAPRRLHLLTLYDLAPLCSA